MRAVATAWSKSPAAAKPSAASARAHGCLSASVTERAAATASRATCAARLASPARARACAMAVNPWACAKEPVMLSRTMASAWVASPIAASAVATEASAVARDSASVTERAVASACSATCRARSRSPATARAPARAAIASTCVGGLVIDRASASARTGWPILAHTAGKAGGITMLRCLSWSWVTAKVSRAARSGRGRPPMNSWATVISASAAASPPLTSSIRSRRARSVARAVIRPASPIATISWW